MERVEHAIMINESFILSFQVQSCAFELISFSKVSKEVSIPEGFLCLPISKIFKNKNP
jgi:hypothetical protein